MRVFAIIQARMGSTRLPGKIVEPLQGKPVLWHVVNRVKCARRLDKVIVATSTKKEDDVVEELARKEDFDYSRGSKENVLERYYEAAREYGAKEGDAIVRALSDCPLIDPEIIDGCVKLFKKSSCDYLGNLTQETRFLPRGIDDVEVFSFSALGRAAENAIENYEKEHVTPYIWENKKNEFTICEPARLKAHLARGYRVTLDYSEDLEVIRKIYDALYRPRSHITTEDVIAFLDAHPEVAAINAHCAQKEIK